MPTHHKFQSWKFQIRQELPPPSVNEEVLLTLIHFSKMQITLNCDIHNQFSKKIRPELLWMIHLNRRQTAPLKGPKMPEPVGQG